MSKTFVISDETLNEFGFWLKTSGADLEQFKKNPIMLWMHSRALYGDKNSVLPIGHWENIRVENDQILADPVFDNDDFSQMIADKVEKGTLRMASAGVFPTEFSRDPVNLKPGQTRETVIKWRMKEASICDIGANDNALVFYDENDNLIKLHDSLEKQYPALIQPLNNNSEMKKLIKLFDLKDNASEDEILDKVNVLTGQLQTLTTANQTLQQKLTSFENEKKTALKAEATTLVDAAVKDGRIEASGKDHFLKMFEADHESTKAALSSMKPRESVHDKIGDGKGADEDLIKLSWEDLDKKNLLEDLRRKHPDVYAQKFEKKFGRKPNKA